ncbi:unnamed protein product [Clonostachys rhizophaga]|uniref:Rhodopsin domain-containing protein n=1 Tax=Clonostachys rhizophaga TaxID=160324 RepID=A0A9N9VLJ0_9HYPO|nr:unnamed protein product [Clonostachys rhizophaga]
MAYSPLAETWGLYAGGSLIFLARIVCRLRAVGLVGFKPDDYIVFLSWATYTVMTVAAHIVGGLGDLHAVSLDARKRMTPEEAAPLIYATKWFCAGVATYILFIWTLKLNMLFLYQRIVNGLWVEKFIMPTIILVLATFVAIYGILFGVCRPYNRMWIVYPDQGEYCQPQSMLNMVPPLVMNIVTDLIIMAIPAPVVVPVKIGIWKRIGLLCLFGAGIFIMVAAILRVTMVLVMKNGPTAAIWSCREDFVAIVVGQAILIRPIFTKRFWTNDYGRGMTEYGSSKRSKNSAHLEESYEMGSKKRGKAKDPFSLTAALATVQEGNGSTEKIIDPSASSISNVQSDVVAHPSGGSSHASSTGHWGNNKDRRSRAQPMVIHVSKDVVVGTEEPKYHAHGSPGNPATPWGST